MTNDNIDINNDSDNININNDNGDTGTPAMVRWVYSNPTMQI